VSNKNFQGYLSDPKQALFLPQGILKQTELKKIDNIFDEYQIETAAEILIAIRDNDNLFSQADILERAYQYGWNKVEKPIIDSVIKNIFSSIVFLKTIRNCINIILIIITIFVALVFPTRYSYLSYEVEQEAKKIFNTPVTWKKKCSDSNKYCLYIRTKGNFNNKRSQKVILDFINTDTKQKLFYRESVYIFQAIDLEGYKFNKFIVNKYKKRIVKPWLKNHYYISDRGNLLIIVPKGRGSRL
jgi:hypothetical protein